ncbi:hypothetical protein CGRA01v4_07422 [Colletotrichum graminicola]|nr:hypothetical protein CGRA01v4_07422 [Colletotrichum graminicola]
MEVLAAAERPRREERKASFCSWSSPLNQPCRVIWPRKRVGATPRLIEILASSTVESKKGRWRCSVKHIRGGMTSRLHQGGPIPVHLLSSYGICTYQSVRGRRRRRRPPCFILGLLASWGNLGGSGILGEQALAVLEGLSSLVLSCFAYCPTPLPLCLSCQSSPDMRMRMPPSIVQSLNAYPQCEPGYGVSLQRGRFTSSLVTSGIRIVSAWRLVSPGRDSLGGGSFSFLSRPVKTLGPKILGLACSFSRKQLSPI